MRGAVLLADADEQHRRSLETSLKASRYTVTIVDSVAAILEAVRVASFDAIVVDFEFCDRLPARIVSETNCTRLPCLVLMWCLANRRDLDTTETAGFNLRLVKPVDPTRVVRFLDGAVQRSHVVGSEAEIDAPIAQKRRASGPSDVNRALTLHGRWPRCT
jgi:DNA-binding NtrC family response regulator